MAKAKSAIPQGLHSVTPHLILDNTAKAVEWYKQAFGATEVGRAVGPDGAVMHTTIHIGNSVLYANDPMGGGKSAKALGGSPIGLWIYTEDCDAMYNRAVASGAEVPPGPMGQMQDQFWGDRCGTVIDPFGYQWTIATHKEDFTPEEMKQRADDFFKNFAHAGKS